MKKLIAEQSFWDLFPQAVIGVVAVSGMKPSSEIGDDDLARIERLLDTANRRAERHLTSETISKNEVVAVWRDAYQKFKTKRGARCSIENLLKRVLKDKPVGHITPAVDLYNAISLSYALPCGGEDIDHIEGDMRLTVTEGGDSFRPLGEDDEPTLPGELCYLDDAGAVCRCWNWRDGVRTALNDETSSAVMIIECVDPSRVDDTKAAITEFGEHLETFFDCEIVSSDMLTADNREIVIA